MSDVFFHELNLPAPDAHLGVGSQPHGAQTGAMLIALEPALVGARPDWVVVYGDTNTTLAGALVASKLGIPLAHVEAGLRSFNRSMPEEINRLVADTLADVLFCPSDTAVANLSAEGIARGVHRAADTMLDVLADSSVRARSTSTILDRLGLKGSSSSWPPFIARKTRTSPRGCVRLSTACRVRASGWCGRFIREPGRRSRPPPPDLPQDRR